MSAQALAEALAGVPGLAVRRDAPAARCSVFRVGGPLELLVVAETEDALVAAARACAAEGLKVHGLEGMELHVHEDGAAGAWLRPGALAEGLALVGEVLDVGARVPAALLAGWAARRGLSGLEALGGRAGTAAEALRAGALAGRVLGLRVLKGQRVGDIAPEALREGHTLLRLRLRVQPDKPARVQAATQKAADRRRGRGPGLPARLMDDPKGDTAAELMADAGLCGVRVRGARLGVHEPNAVINLGGATPSDLKLLATLTRDRVKALTGVELTPTIKPAGTRR